MALGLLLLPAVGGYWLLTHWNYTRYRAVRDSGYHLLFRSVLFGIPLYCLARFLTFVSDCFYSPLTKLWDAHVPVPFTSEVILSIAIGFLLPIVFNRFYTSEEGAKKTAREVGDHIELLIDRSMHGSRLIELTLRNRKTYIGYAVESGIGRTSDGDIVLLPLQSGYRYANTLQLRLTTSYIPIIDLYLQGESKMGSRDLTVVIPLSEIVSARHFDQGVYQTFQEH